MSSRDVKVPIEVGPDEFLSKLNWTPQASLHRRIAKFLPSPLRSSNLVTWSAWLPEESSKLVPGSATVLHHKVKL